MTRANVKTVAYWLTTVFGPASFVVGGVMHLTRHPEVMASLEHFGYPAWFSTIIGTWKLLGAIAVVVPGVPLLKEWAYAGFFFLLTGAAASHAMSGDPLFGNTNFQIAPALFFLALTLASWALRPESRRLPGTALRLPEAAVRGAGRLAAGSAR
jgi:hypothetical protein